MKSFLKDISIFLCLLLAINFLIFFRTKKYYSEYSKVTSKEFRSFLFADSHGEKLGRNTEILKIYNFSANGDSYQDIRRKILMLLKQGFAFDTVYISVDDHLLSPYRENHNNTVRSSRISNIDEYDSNYEYIKHKHLLYYFPIFQPEIRSLVVQMFKSKFNTFLLTTEGQIKEKDSWDELEKSERTQLSKERMNYQFSFNHKSEKHNIILNDIITICNKNNLQLIGVKFPISPTYINVLKEKTFGADKLFKKRGLTVLDKKLLFEFNKEYFIDPDHMTREGGRMFLNHLFD